MTRLNYYGHYPTADGRFGSYGGMYVPETLVPAIMELKEAYSRLKDDPSLLTELDELRREYAGRPTPLTLAGNLSKQLGCRIYLKREDLLHGGAHKLNNTLGQALLAKKMGKKCLIAETGAGQHGFATAMTGARFGMPVKIFMGTVDIERQAYNVNRMRVLGAEIVPVDAGSKTLKEATSEALRYWTSHVSDTHYLIGSVVGPHPYPAMVRDFQKVIGEEIKQQVMQKEGKLPRGVVACVGGGSNAMGAFHEFIEDPEVELWGVEAAGEGISTGKHAAALNGGSEGVLHGAMQLLLQDHERNVLETHSISAGLDYPGVGPELCHLKTLGRLSLAHATDAAALDAFHLLARAEGIIPALESSHAISFATQIAKKYAPEDVLVINLSGGGGKDMGIIMKAQGVGEP